MRALSLIGWKQSPSPRLVSFWQKSKLISIFLNIIQTYLNLLLKIFELDEFCMYTRKLQ